MEERPVAILLAVYNPPLDWFGELLDSLDAQTYPNLRLYIRDDASSSPAPEQLEAFLEEHLLRLPYQFVRNAENLGSNATFAALTEDATEDLVAFCDQDDIWLPDKIERSVRLLEESPLRPVQESNLSVPTSAAAFPLWQSMYPIPHAAPLSVTAALRCPP